MKLHEAIKVLGKNQATQIAQNLAAQENISWDDGPSFIFSVIVNDQDRIPGNIGSTKDSETVAIQKWLKKYKGGYDGRASKRISNLPGTVADPVIDKIIGARLKNLTDIDLNKIAYAHRVGMSAENILGLLLNDPPQSHSSTHGFSSAGGAEYRSRHSDINAHVSFVSVEPLSLLHAKCAHHACD